jgi:D-alanyl-D-alanine carboxypeptidase
VKDYLPQPPSGKGGWAVQAGAFASYAKAESEALKIKNKLSGRFAARGTHVEKFAKNGVSMYRAQVTGFSKADAQKACAHLKNTGLSCLVAAVKSDTAYAQK